MNRNVLRLRLIAVGIAGVGLAVVLRNMLAPMPPTGPLALVERQVGTQDSLTSGILEITDECVRLAYSDGSSSLVIWTRGSVTWNETDRSIGVSNPDGDGVTLRDGDAVSLGGGGGPAATLESAGSWVSRPGATCEAPEWFLAVEVLVAEEN